MFFVLQLIFCRLLKERTKKESDPFLIRLDKNGSHPHLNPNVNEGSQQEHRS